MTVSLNGTSGITFSDASAQNTAATGFGFKNRIINGAMDFAQRGTSFSTPTNSTYTLDRWQIQWAGATPATVAQVTGPTGFRNALRITGAASNTLTNILQRVESYNCSDLSGATITIQANIAVSSAQTVLWQLYYATAQDNFSGTTLISSGTWSATTTATTFTATIASLPSGATNGLQLVIYPNNAGAFTSGTITVTGVQLEKSPTATSFDYRPYGTELALCQRYYQQTFAAWGSWSATNTASAQVPTPVSFRVSPSVSYTGTVNGQSPSVNTWTSTTQPSSVNGFGFNPNYVFFTVTGFGGNGTFNTTAVMYSVTFQMTAEL